MFEGFGEKIDNPEQRYYWLVYELNYSNQKTEVAVADIHPFDFMIIRRRNWKQDLILLNWREIDKSEYNLFNS